MTRVGGLSEKGSFMRFVCNFEPRSCQSLGPKVQTAAHFFVIILLIQVYAVWSHVYRL